MGKSCANEVFGDECVGALQILGGREFKSVGAATLKALSPKRLSLVLGIELFQIKSKSVDQSER